MDGLRALEVEFTLGHPLNDLGFHDLLRHQLLSSDHNPPWLRQRLPADVSPFPSSSPASFSLLPSFAHLSFLVPPVSPFLSPSLSPSFLSPFLAPQQPLL